MRRIMFLAMVAALLGLLILPGAAGACEWDKSTLEWSCINIEGGVLHAKVCNNGNDMQGTTTWKLYWKDSTTPGSPRYGQFVTSGTIPALKSGECYDIYFTFSGKYEAGDKYAFKAYQRPGHPGIDVLWITSSEYGPCPPVPNAPVIALMGLGILGLGGFVLYRRQQQGKAAA